MIIPVKTKSGGYEIVLERGALSRAGELLNLNRRVLVVTDDGVPPQYAATIKERCLEGIVVTLPQGEGTKNMDSFILLLKKLTEHAFTRTDCVVAVGGGVMGDLAGFAASCYMRGIDFYNIPTTVLSQVDSSIGGKTAIDFEGYKNIVGAFYPPKAVIIDPDTLKTLPPRQISNGLAESVKMALTFDSELFELIETGEADIENIIYRSLLIKKSVVEQDEHEGGLRKVLNFGHTLSHAIEVNSDFLHGECVGLGMLYMCADNVRTRLLPVLERLGLPTKFDVEAEKLTAAINHDKKKSGDTITVIYVDKIGSFEMKQVQIKTLTDIIKGV